MNAPETSDAPVHIAYFVTHHGLGHATRACAVMQAACRQLNNLRFEIFSEAPAWVFQESLSGTIGYHPAKIDLGFVQRSPFTEDIRATRAQLSAWLPFERKTIQSLARRITRLQCRVMVCDISPLGIAVAEAAKLPSLLIENFTWDWMLSGYGEIAETLGDLLIYLKNYYRKATVHVQTEPVCRPAAHALQVAPICRRPKSTKSAVRKRLGIPEDRKTILVTMGGVPHDHDYRLLARRAPEVAFIVPGQQEEMTRSGNCIHLPLRASFYHPDLIEASDLIVAKAGYSTLAETYYAGKPMAYVTRPAFPESPCLKRFIDRHMHAVPLEENDVIKGGAIDSIMNLLDRTAPKKPQRKNGADQAANILLTMLEHQTS